MARRPSLKQQFLAAPLAQNAARLYLAERGYNPTKLSPNQLYRYTSAVARAEIEGRPLPTLGELRGHAEQVSVEHIELDRASRHREHYFIRRSQKVEEQAAVFREQEAWEALRSLQFTHADFRRLCAAVQKADKAAGHTRVEWPIICRGWARQVSNPATAEESDGHGLYFIKGSQVSARNDNIVWYLTTENQESLPLIDFLNMLYADNNVDWVDISQIAIALFYEGQESAESQQRKKGK